ncbi:uncharacterized protein, partial [Littorina saxatilis]|uniref:uncharacterized protein n=1 Tax=Littorina saxatilis TaxID=31220 RepID=UPI0038B66AF2
MVPKQHKKRRRLLNIKMHPALALVVVLASILPGAHADVYKECGGFVKEHQGVIQSPQFPHRFPVPINCRWIIQAPPEKKIVLYFTQYFLRGSFHLTEYEQYVNSVTYDGRKPLGQIDFRDHIRTVVAYKPFLVLDFVLHHMSNIHLRVEEYLEDVYGFNITYAIVDRGDQVRQDTCSVNDCSFLGHCLASADFSTYRCDCFPQFFGKECQYGPFCDPDKGINMCLNQGRCRYFYGSMVNTCECPPGYTGAKCEQKEDSLDTVHRTGLSSDEDKEPECKRLGCSDHCTRNYEGVLYCDCPDGFKLDTDNVTCIEREMFRVSVSVPLVNRPAEWNEERATSSALVILQISGVRTAEEFQFDGVNSSDGQEVLMYHFYIDRSDLGIVTDGVKTLMRRDRLFNLTIVSANCSIHLDPEMKLLNVEHYDARPALEGKSLTLVCTARGSSRLKFRWYKDKFLFNASLTSRNAWEVRINDDYDDKQMSIFNVDGVTMFDKGEFSCEIEDFGEVENKTVTVDVMPLPHVEIKPLTASLLLGQPVSFRCLSPDENMRTFTYKWLRNGQEVSKEESVNKEIVEDLLPSGSRLYIPRLSVSANYTCRVANKAGASEKSAFVFVISPNMSETVCESDSLKGVKWNRTYGGYYDLQKCPIDTADFKVVGLGEGYARRDCVCDVTCHWGPPNYARCHSVHLIHWNEQLERCQLGYQLDGLSNIYDSLYELLRKARNRTLAGDVDMFAINLHTLFDVTLRFPAVAPDPQRSSFNLKTVASFMNILLEEVKSTNSFEKQDLSVGARFLRVCEILSELTNENPTLIPLSNITLPRIEFAVKNMTIPSHTASEENELVQEAEYGPSRLAYKGRQLMSLLAGSQTNEEKTKQVQVLQVTFSPDIFLILSVNRRIPEYEEFLTPLVSLLPVGNEADDEDFSDLQDRRVELEFHHHSKFPVFVENTTKCVAWERRDVWQLVGEWKTGICDVTHRTANVTKCLCPVHGHYAVVVIATNVTMTPILPIQRDTVLLVGCILSVCGLTAALVVYFVNWRHMAGDTTIIHANFILSLAGINLVCILCLSHTEREVLCIVSKLVIHFLQLAAFSFLLMEAIHTYVCIQSRSHGAAHIKNTSLKYFLIGWGIPSIATIAVFLLSEVFEFEDSCNKWCWWTAGEWQHYSFLVPVVVMVLAQVLILSACLLCTRLWKDERRFSDRRRCVYIVIRAFVLQTLVVLLSVSGHVTEGNPSLSHQGFFVAVNLILTITVILTLLILKPHVRRMVFSILLPEHKRALAFGSFRAFVLPDRVEDTEEVEVKQIQQYCAEIDRSKFTSQHKQNLRNLLGSSSSGSEASGTVSSPGSLSVAGPALPMSCRTNSGGSRNSCSEVGAGRGGGGVG